MYLILIILLLIFLIVGYPLLKTYMALRAARRKFDEMFGGGNAGASRARQQQAGAQQRQHRSPRRRTKIITRDVGEYVEFEEIPGKPESRSTSATYTETTQIEDADWEEIR